MCPTLHRHIDDPEPFNVAVVFARRRRRHTRWPMSQLCHVVAPRSDRRNVGTLFNSREYPIAVVFSLVAGFTARRVFTSNPTWRCAAWAALSGCVAVGPVTLAITPPLVGRRVTYNDRMAAERFASLKNAVERTAEPRDPSRLCDGTELEHHYSGPPFSDQDWHRITGNYVKQDGYFFMVYCREKGGYTIDAGPARERGDGTRRFCTDESGRSGCRMEWDDSRHQCLPCQK
jgi:hypothetical protein